MTQTKQQLRQAMTAVLTKLEPTSIATASEAVRERLLVHPAYVAARYLACYAAFGVEIDLAPLARLAHRQGKTLCYPRYDAAARVYVMVAMHDPERELVPGHWGLLEPAPELPAVDEALRRERLVWLVPGLAFDAAGHRLGRGAGYYDRMMAGARGPKIGIAHDCQIVDGVPTGATDVNLDWIVSDRRTVRCSG